MSAGVSAVVHALGARDADGVVHDLDLQLLASQAGQLGHEHQIIALAEDVERRIGAAAANPHFTLGRAHTT